MIPLAVFGDPIAHSLSPQIHELFAQQTGLQIDYRRILAPSDTFAQQLRDFVAAGGRGANITLPHKVAALSLMDSLSPRAQVAGAMNTVVVKDSGQLLGDNTDGIGLCQDLERQFGDLNGARLLVLGAGGAVRGIIQPLLEAGAAELQIYNRTRARAEQLVADFAQHPVRLWQPGNGAFDGIINASAGGHQGSVPALEPEWVKAQTFAYDLSYGAAAEPFINHCGDLSLKCSDGLGMLVAQGAASFHLWTGEQADFADALQQLRRMTGEPV
ncbi:shikimate dehydrogenase [Aliidiomarina sp. Khilg15.8]